MLSRTRDAVQAEFRTLWRDPSARVLLAVPLLAWLLFSYTVDIDTKTVPAVFLDSARDAESRQLIAEFATTRYFHLVGEVHSEPELQAALVSGRAKVGIRIPPDYSSNLLGGRQGRVHVVIDGSDSMTALLILNASQQLGFLKSLEREGISPAMFSVEVRPQLLFDSDLESTHYYLPGLLALTLFFLMLALAAFALQGRNRPAERAPEAAKPDLLAGKFLSHVALGSGYTVVLLVLMVFLFGMPVRGSMALLLVSSLLFIVSAFGIGLGIAALAGGPGQAVQWSGLAVLSTFFLSGFVFPRGGMPPAVYVVSQLHPATYYLEILRAALLRGAGPGALWDQMLALAGFAILCTAFAARCLRERSG